MDCVHDFVLEGNCKSCILCGVVEECPYECTFQNSSYIQSHSPFFAGYCRKKRFKNLTQCLFFPCPSRADDQMLQHFTENKLAPSVQGIESALRNSGFKDKRFSCIHLYAMLFARDYVPFTTPQLFKKQERLLFFFELFESQYNRIFHTGFINYNFILSYLLQGVGLDVYMPFIKKTKCRRRRKFYKRQLKKLNFSFHVHP